MTSIRTTQEKAAQVKEPQQQPREEAEDEIKNEVRVEAQISNCLHLNKSAVVFRVSTQSFQVKNSKLKKEIILPNLRKIYENRDRSYIFLPISKQIRAFTEVGF